MVLYSPDAAPGAGAAPAPAPAAPPASPPAAAPSSAPEPSAEQLARVFEFDPFGDSPTTDTISGEASVAGIGAEAPSADTVAPASPGPEVQLLTRIADRLEQPAQQPTPAAQPTQTPGPYDDIPTFDKLAFPKEWLAALYSEDPNQRVAAVHQIGRTQMRIAVATAREMMRREFASVIPRLVGELMETRQATTSIQQDFFSTHQDLADPALRPLVAGVTADVIAANPQATWGPELRDFIAEQVKTRLRRFQPAAAAPAAPPAVAPRLSPSGSRPGNGVAATGQMKDIMDLMGP